MLQLHCATLVLSVLPQFSFLLNCLYLKSRVFLPPCATISTSLPCACVKLPARLNHSSFVCYSGLVAIAAA